jgi:integrase
MQNAARARDACTKDHPDLVDHSTFAVEDLRGARLSRLALARSSLYSRAHEERRGARERALIGVLAAVSPRGGRGRTKTEASKRYVEMLPMVQHALREQRAASQLRSSYIFPSRAGGPLNITNVRERVWKPALQRAGLRYRTMYQTRHTFATLALQSNEQIGWVSKQLGHTSDEMVIRHYAKFIPNLTRQDGSALAKVMQEQGLA